MEHQFKAIAIDWLINIGFGVIALVAALVTIALCDRVLFKQIDFLEEIKRGNIAAAIAFGMMLAFAALIISAAVR